MKEDICTIPVNEVFAQKDGCPICRMRNELELRALDFVMGAAMMEPSVRHETNRFGFCPEHFGKMKGMKNHLSLALMLESHLMEIDNAVFEKCKPTVLRGSIKSAEESGREAAGIVSSCYVCDRMERSLRHELETLFVMWKKDAGFRDDVASQKGYCLPHYALLVEIGQKSLDKKSFPEFYDAVSKVTRTALKALTEDATAFCKMYDYHNNGADFGGLRDSVRNSIAFLTGGRTV
jgi:hypothetical protein